MHHVRTRCSRRSIRSAVESLEPRTLLSAGDLDPTFGTGGKVLRAANGMQAVLVQNDGKVLLAGRVLERLNADGSIDPSFGVSRTGFVDPGFAATSAVLQPDGKILIAGGTGAVVRYNTDGTVDRSFGVSGIAQSPAAIQDPALALAPDGRVVEAGYLPTNDSGLVVAVARFTADGKTDTSFHSSGFLLQEVNSLFNYETRAVAVQADGKVLLGAEFGFDMAVWRYNTDGSLDTSFGLGGMATEFRGDGDVSDDNYDDYSVSQIVVQPDGRILVAGPANQGVGVIVNWAIDRFNPNGDVDTSWAQGGLLSVGGLGHPFVEDGSPYLPGGLALQSDGKVLISGVDIAQYDTASQAGHLGPFVVMRYRADGTPDANFHSQDIGFFDQTRGTGGIMALAPDGRIVVAGDVSSDPGPLVYMGVARLLGDPPVPFASPFAGHPAVAGARAFEAEDFDNGGEGIGSHVAMPQGIGGLYRTTAVPIVSNPSASNCNYVAPHPGDWLQYTVYVPVTDSYVFAARVASAAGGGTFHATVDGSDFTGPITVPPTGTPTSWGTVSSHRFDLAVGVHTLRVYFDHSAGPLVGNFDSFRLIASEAAPVQAGSLDPTFAVEGRQLYNDPTFDSSVQHRVSAVAVQANGKIVVAGSVGNQSDKGIGVIYLQRLNGDGSVDTTFGTGGEVQTPPPFSFATSILIQPDGKILVGGASENDPAAPLNAEFELLRYNADGSLDRNFGNGGIVITDFPGNEKIDSLAFAPGGKIVAAGASFLYPNVGFDVAVYHGDGSLDPSFNGTGKLTKSLGPTSNNSGPVGLAVQPDGKIIVAAHAGSYPALYRLNADGSPDLSFGAAGVAIGDQPETGNVNKLVIQSDGKIVSAGPGFGGNRVDRFNPDGSIDTSFGQSGDLVAGSEVGNPVAGLMLDPTGHIILVGVTNYFALPHPLKFFVDRLDADGKHGQVIEDSSFLPTDPFGDNIAQAAVLTPDGRVIVAGDIFAGTQFQSQHWVGLARYTFASSVPGDANGDGAVDFGDLLAVAQNYGRTGAVRSQGDVNFDGVVNFADLLLIAQNYRKPGTELLARFLLNATAGHR